MTRTLEVRNKVKQYNEIHYRTKATSDKHISVGAQEAGPSFFFLLLKPTSLFEASPFKQIIFHYSRASGETFYAL